MRASVGFLLRFFAFAGVLFAFWSFGGLGDAYARIVIGVTNPFMRLTSGFHVSQALPTERGLDLMISRGRGDVPMPLQPRELFSGLIPFLALIGATAPLSLRRRAVALLAGLGILLPFHVGLLLIGPYMTGIPQATLPDQWIGRVNTVIDVFYGFYGLVGFAALPFLLWWWLAYRPASGAGSSP